MKPRRLAVFDVDGTLVDGQTQAMLVRHMTERNMLGLPTQIAVAAWFAAYRLGIPVSGEGIRRLVLKSLRGMTSSEVATLAHDLFVSRVRGRLRPKGMQLLRELKDEGCLTVLVSASAAPIVSHIADELGASGWIATELEVENGCLTGDISGEVVDGGTKVTRLTAWADAAFPSWVVAVAYGDHESDAAMLRLAVTPYVVNPTPALRRLAADNGWACLEW